jgi:hypothetical protein
MQYVLEAVYNSLVLDRLQEYMQIKLIGRLESEGVS